MDRRPVAAIAAASEARRRVISLRGIQDEHYGLFIDSSANRPGRPGPERERAGVGLERGWYGWCKRFLDLIGSVTLLVLLMPFLVAIGLGVRLSSPGPMLFQAASHRAGGRRPSGVTSSAPWSPTRSRDWLARADCLRCEFFENYKLDDDPRVTRLGAFLRRTSLDELPQLWNVVRGDMTLIGPRPIIVPELTKYGAYGDTLLTVKPGLGGVWQVSGRSDTSYDERVQMDMHYIANRSLWFDLNLIVLTALAVLRRRGAR